MKRVFSVCLGLLAVAMASLTLSAAAGAADAPASDTGPNGEKAEATMTLAAKSGTLYQGGVVPADWSMFATVTEPYLDLPGGQDIFPLNEIRLKLPTDMSFNPDPKMAVCTDAMIGPNTNMSQPPVDIIKLCPKSVIGNGTAHMYLAHKNLPGGPGLKDPVLIVYNAGFQNGQPKIKVHGYSKGTGVGIFIQGVLQKDGTLILQIPQLSSDSAVGYINLNIPGPKPVMFNYKSVPESVGQDPNYLRAKCSTGTWNMGAEFVLGTRDTNSQPISDRYPVDAPPFSTTCEGTPGNPPNVGGGKAKIGKVTVKGAGKAKRGKNVTYRVTVRNAGKGVAKNVRVTAKGKGAKGSGRIGKIPAGKSKTVRVKVKFTKKGKSKVTFTATAKGAGKKNAKKVVRVR